MIVVNIGPDDGGVWSRGQADVRAIAGSSREGTVRDLSFLLMPANVAGRVVVMFATGGATVVAVRGRFVVAAIAEVGTEVDADRAVVAHAQIQWRAAPGRDLHQREQNDE